MKRDRRDYETGTSQFFQGPARIYRSDDNFHCVILPEKLGIELDAITEFKKTIGIDMLSGSLPYYCILPEQIFEAIRELPEPHLVKEVILKDNAEDEVSTAGSGSDSLTTSTIAAGRIILSPPLTQNQLQPILLKHCSNFSDEGEKI
ncbi:hypothetical protein BH10CYA1_BH10CYA1_18410 [soil metagenome]